MRGWGHLGGDLGTPRIPGSASLSWDGSDREAPVIVRPEEGPLLKVEVFGLDFVSPSPRVQATPEPRGCQAGSRMGTLARGPGGGAGAPRGHCGPSSKCEGPCWQATCLSFTFKMFSPDALGDPSL